MAQAGAGARFDARDPVTCTEKSEPAEGAIPATVAAQYVACEQESADQTSLRLVDQMKVEVGASRPFQFETDAYDTVDPNKPVYPIRGSYVRYYCTQPNAAVGNIGANCNLYDQPHASGICSKTTFGEWYCNMQDRDNTNSALSIGVPPPR
jgi:hypothetical protein